MLRNYLKIAIRNLLHRRFYSIINILGLSLGLTAVAIVILYTRYEYSFDSQWKSADRTWRISGKQQDTWFAALSKPYSEALYNSAFPEIDRIARVRRYMPKFIQYEQDKFYEQKVLITDPGTSFFSIFNIPFIRGNAAAALKKPYSVVLTESVAKKLFGQSDPLNKSLLFDTLQLTVTGVFKDLPANTHLDVKVLFTDEKAMQEASGIFTYCQLRENTNISAFKNKIMAFPKPTNKFSILQDVTATPLASLHFEENMTYEMKPAGNKLYLLLFNIVGLMIVFLSCINYMNLSIAVYADRRKEIAVRKVAGAGNVALAIQFLTEAVCLSILCIPVTAVLLELILPWFNQFMNVQLRNEFITSFTGAGLMLGVTLLIGIISGSYPAWVLPKLKAISLFRKINIGNKSGLSLRQVLVTFQMTVLVMILSGSWVIRSQLQYIQEKNLGFHKEGVLKLSGASMVDSAHYFTLKNELLKNPRIKSVSMGYAPGDENYGSPFKGQGSEAVYNDLMYYGIDYDYLSTLGLELVKADFTDIKKEQPRRLVLVNETLATRLGYKDPVGKKFITDPGMDYARTFTISGVVKDFHFSSLHNQVAPMMLNVRTFGSGVFDNILVKVQTEHLPETLEYIRKQTAGIVTDIPLNLQFLDENLGKMYEKEQKLSVLSRVLLLVTLLLSVTGLVGLAAYMTELRTKEIGIRKVLGASVLSILKLLGSSFTRMAIVAMIIGSGLSVLVMYKWLENFAYKVSLTWTVFAGASVVLLAVILATVFGHSIKAATGNPIKSLRTE